MPGIDINVPGLPQLTRAVERLDTLGEGLGRALWLDGFRTGLVLTLIVMGVLWWFRNRGKGDAS
jgi:hypothetical protein